MANSTVIKLTNTYKGNYSNQKFFLSSSHHSAKLIPSVVNYELIVVFSYKTFGTIFVFVSIVAR